MANRAPRVLYRCPLCAKISPKKKYLAGERGEHSVEAMVVSFVGGGRTARERDADGKVIPDDTPRGFAWTRRDLTPGERDELVRIARAVADRLYIDLVTNLLDDTVEDEAFEKLCEEYEQDARDEVARREHMVVVLTENRLSTDRRRNL